NGREDFPDPDLAADVFDESGNGRSAVGVNRVSGARRPRTRRLEQPTAFAQIHAHYSALFRRSIRVLGFPAAQITRSSLEPLRARAYAQGIIAIAHKRRRDSRVSQDG